MLAINDDKTLRLLVIFALVAATAYLMLSVQQPQPVHVILKTALCLFLAAAAWRAQRPLLVLALLFSASGDALLGIDAALLPLGALLFMASDSLIALSKFLWSAPWVGPTIWITYAAAQLLIVCGLLASGEPATDRAS
ncbi:MAG TPA: lysoplasmalogenase family protein [Povalibacter sp.]|uniref:lysoplasmalogenase family protein n=1 Tax=Povalibacter sp. TaxID=1962978 RepID=UPI002BB75506|nr:lysoplasmalogenase family protein [Povalibacter sp.]HMN45577.1 lysoplasmalogenase family protein [Povalibacter sp.]